MVPAISSGAAINKPVQPAVNVAVQNGNDNAQAAQPRSSEGVAAPAKARPETTASVDPSRQASNAPRLREQETAERTDREPQKDLPAGPPPAFEETPLQRASRLAFSPPELVTNLDRPIQPVASSSPESEEVNGNTEVAAREPLQESPQDLDSQAPTAATRLAEESIAAARNAIKTTPLPAFDVAR